MKYNILHIFLQRGQCNYYENVGKHFFKSFKGKSNPQSVLESTWKQLLCFSVNIVYFFVNGSVFMLLFCLCVFTPVVSTI